MKKIEGGVTAAKGFMASSTAAAIKYKGRTDMAMVYSEKPCAVAGTFTTNVVKAAPVIWDRNIVKEKGVAQAVVINSGIANACTGEEGLKYCEMTAEAVSKALDVPKDMVMVGSTGVIGMQLPIDRICNGVNDLAKKLDPSIAAGNEAARAIMTTDTKEKEIAYTFEISGKTVTIGGMAKGSGMIHPNMCTMLSYITTDALISQKLMQQALSEIVKDSFNMISVDGDTSTNDTLLVFANGMAGNDLINTENEDYKLFYDALNEVCTYLAKQMAADGEGATKLVESVVLNADTKENARTLAKSVVCSSLTKAAMYGNDANWGRILCALGYSGVEFNPDKVDLYFQHEDKKILIFTNGSGTDFSEEEATEILKTEHVVVISDMNMGSESATAFGCDLTHEYVNINADYRS